MLPFRPRHSNSALIFIFILLAVAIKVEGRGGIPWTPDRKKFLPPAAHIAFFGHQNRLQEHPHYNFIPDVPVSTANTESTSSESPFEDVWPNTIVKREDEVLEDSEETTLLADQTDFQSSTTTEGTLEENSELSDAPKSAKIPDTVSSPIIKHGSRRRKPGGDGAPDPSLRLRIPNPGLTINDTDAKEILSLIMSNPLVKAKFDNALESPGFTQGDWKGGCLAKDTKFPTVSLKFDISDGKGSSASRGSQDVRINKFYGVKRDRFYVQNTGIGKISIKFEPEAPTSEATIRGQNWSDEYVLAKGDLYWSMDNNHGAQHSVNGQPYALELQLVHYSKKYGSLEKAAKQQDGLVIASILFEAFGKHNPALEPVANAAMAVGFANNKWRQVHGVLDLKMLFPVDMSYYSYKGPYIGEPCVQTATWYVFRRPMIVSNIQLQKFREVRDHNAKRCSGVFMPLSSSNDSLADDRKVISSGNEQSFLIVVPEESLNVGVHLDHGKGITIFILATLRFFIAIYLF